MRLTLRTELPQWLLIAAMFLAGAIAWPFAPERIPAHWNAYGQIDRYGGKFEGLLMLPLMALGLYLLLIVVPKLDPGRANYDRFRIAYAIIRIAILALLAAIQTVILLVAFGVHVEMNLVVMPLMGVMLIVLGGVMGKIRPNWFVGVRTPWTLSSKLSWSRTHRLGGWLFILVGLLAIGLAFAPQPWGLFVWMSSIVVATLGLVVYSYFVWRQDPDRVPPAGTAPSEE
jgi:uncharacterized membrane protein